MSEADKKLMSVSEETLSTITETLLDHKQRVQNDEKLNPVEDALEVEVEGGRIWVHPRDDGESVDIHLISDSPRGHSEHTSTDSSVRSKISSILVHKLGDRDVFTPFIGPERHTYRVEFLKLHDPF